MKRRHIRLLVPLAAGTSIMTFAAFQKDLGEAKLRVRAGQRFVESPFGPIEFAEAGDGPAVLVIHGAGGGFDQGLSVGRAFAGDHYRVIAPSRFGYLGTALPADASAAAQADAHARLLDSLDIGKVPVIGISAGAPSAMQLCIRHPEHCSALILIVPLAWAPAGASAGPPPSRAHSAIVNSLLSSNFAYWLATKLAHGMVVKRILGTPVEVYRNATPEERQLLDRTMEEILPVSERVNGLLNEGRVAEHMQRFPLEKITVPTLVFSAEDDGYRTYTAARYTATETRGEFVGFPTGGHFLVGHGSEVRAKIAGFLAQTRSEVAEPELVGV